MESVEEGVDVHPNQGVRDSASGQPHGGDWNHQTFNGEME